MPQAPKKNCTTPGCKQPSTGGACADCRARRRGRAPGVTRRSRHERGYDHRHEKWRKVVLQRDPFCKWPGCFLPSTQADHVVPTSQGGARLDPDNGQGLCDEHHTEKTWLENLEGAPVRAAGRVLVVSGPPGSGKSSYVARHRRDGDLVFDYDEIACALTGQRMYEYSDEVKRFVNATRRAIVAEVRRSGPRQKLWMIAGAPRSGERHRYRVELAAITVVLEVPPGECVRRIAADARRADQLDRWREAVEAWWAVYGPSPLDRVLKPAALPTRRAS